MEKIIARTVDLETTDFPPAGGVIELGYVDSILERDISGPWKVSDPSVKLFQKFFDPGEEKKLSLEALSTHHIQEHQFRGCTSSSELEDYVYDSNPNILVAHAADFEKSFIPTRPGVFWVDTYKVALRAFPDFVRHHNQFLRYAFALDLSEHLSMPPHRACPDAYTTSHIFNHLLNSGVATLKQMIEWSREPPYVTKFTFGKYFGKKIEEVPLDYLQWILSQKGFDEGVRAACNRVLEALK